MNITAEFLIDNCNYVVKLVEEWGCNLGEDAFMTEEVIDSRPETLSQPSNMNDLEEVQGEWELDDLVTDLHRELGDHEGQNVGSKAKQNSIKKQQTNHADGLILTKQHLMSVSTSKSQVPDNVTVLSPVRESPSQQIPGTNSVKETGPWSLNWLSKVPIKEGGSAFTSTRSVDFIAEPDAQMEKYNALPSKVLTKKKQKGSVKNYVGFMKRIARMSDVDRKDILKILNKKRRKSKGRMTEQNSKAAANTSDSSKNSSSSVNKDWENWVVLHGNLKVVAEDVRDIGKVVGVKYNFDTLNSFNLLTKDGRKDWRAVGVSELGSEGVGGCGGAVEWC